MKYTLIRPCQHCPFRTDIHAFLTAARAAEISEAITEQQGTFACHETTVDVEDEEGLGDRAVTDDSQHCAGALILLEKLERPNQMMRIAERLGLYDRRKLDMNSPVFDSVQEFIAAQPR